MSSKAAYFLNKTLGEDFDSSLQKFELYKQGTRTVIDHEELRTALQIVPRTIMSLLIRELTPMEIGETKVIHLPVGGEANLEVVKQERDVYTGQIIHDTKKIVDIQYRSIPGIGLIVMSAFELYDVDKLEDTNPQVNNKMSSEVQRLVDERLALHSMVNSVVDKKLLERDAVQQLILAKLTHAMETPKAEKEPEKPEIKIEKMEEPKKPKGSPLKDFLEKRKKKKPKEFHVEMHKGETVTCPDCGQNIFSGDAYSGCVCYGDCGKVHIKKTESGIKVRFGRGWDIENIEMLLETLWRRNGK